MLTCSYEKDLAGWIHQQMDYLRNGQYDKIDIENLIQEVEGVVKTEKRSMKSHFVILIGNLLKIEYQPSKRSKFWYFSVENARKEIEGILEDSPSLKKYLQFAFEQSWNLARKLAVSDTNMSSKDFPVACPWSVDYVMDKKFDIEKIKSTRLCC